MASPTCFHVSDLHGSERRYSALFSAIFEDRPAAVFLGGDLLPSSAGGDHLAERFIRRVFEPGFTEVHDRLGDTAPRVFRIPGNDDPASLEPLFADGERAGLWTSVHRRVVPFGAWSVLGYACVPPTPFQLKDWERYDVSRFVDPGCLSPEEGVRTVAADADDVRFGTIAGDLEKLAVGLDPERTVALFHAPPYRTRLDRAALDGRMVDHVPMDVHVGSIAVERFLRDRGPAVSLHGHVHESARLTGGWHEVVGATHALSAAHDGPELALVRFDPADPETATRTLLG